MKSYLNAVGDSAEKVYKEVVKLKCTHEVSSASWDQMEKNKSITCNACASIALQLAGCLDKGVRVGHVSTKGKKETDITSINQAMYNADKLKHCRLLWCDCKYSKLPTWLKKRGVVYIQWSNACVNAGDGYIWSCNQQGGYSSGRYVKYKGGVLANHDTYPFGGTIFVAILPDDKWLQHLAVECILGLHGNGEDRKQSLGKDYDKVQSFVNKMLRNEAYFLRWAADYVLELYAGNGSARRKLFGDHYDKVHKKVNWICEQADLCCQGKAPSGDKRKIHYGDDYDFVQRQINRIA